MRDRESDDAREYRFSSSKLPTFLKDRKSSTALFPVQLDSRGKEFVLQTTKRKKTAYTELVYTSGYTIEEHSGEWSYFNFANELSA